MPRIRVTNQKTGRHQQAAFEHKLPPNRKKAITELEP
jgi:hypothetical protein